MKMLIFNISEVELYYVFGNSGCLVFVCKLDSQLEGPGSTAEIPSVGVFLRDPCAYLNEFRKETTKNFLSNSQIDKRDQALKPAPVVY